jgi:hypothetical protein
MTPGKRRLAIIDWREAGEMWVDSSQVKQGTAVKDRFEECSATMPGLGQAIANGSKSEQLSVFA